MQTHDLNISWLFKKNKKSYDYCYSTVCYTVSFYFALLVMLNIQWFLFLTWADYEFCPASKDYFVVGIIHTTVVDNKNQPALHGSFWVIIMWLYLPMDNFTTKHCVFCLLNESYNQRADGCTVDTITITNKVCLLGYY